MIERRDGPLITFDGAARLLFQLSIGRRRKLHVARSLVLRGPRRAALRRAACNRVTLLPRHREDPLRVTGHRNERV